MLNNPYYSYVKKVLKFLKQDILLCFFNDSNSESTEKDYLQKDFLFKRYFKTVMCLMLIINLI